MPEPHSRPAHRPVRHLAAGLLALMAAFATTLAPVPAVSKETCRNLPDQPPTLAEVEQKGYWGVLTIAPRKFAAKLVDQVNAFRDGVFECYRDQDQND